MIKKHTALMTLIPTMLAAHPDHDTKPGTELDHPVLTGNGAWTYEAVPHWGTLPDKTPIGPTHGGVLVGPDGNVYLSTEHEMSIIVWQEDGKFVKTIAPECQGFHAMQVAEENGRCVIYGAQNNGYGNWIGVHATNLRRPCSVTAHGEFLAVAELEARVTILDKSGTPVAFLGDNPDKSQWANFGVKPEDHHLGIFTAPHGIGFAPNGDLYVQDWNVSGRVTKLRRK